MRNMREHQIFAQDAENKDTLQISVVLKSMYMDDLYLFRKTPGSFSNTDMGNAKLQVSWISERRQQ